MGLVCDSLNMCRKREEFVRAYPEFAKTLNPDFCPFCGKKWYTSAIIDNTCLTIKSSGCEYCGGKLQKSPAGILYCHIHGIQSKHTAD